jgi:hypothetical protein
MRALDTLSGDHRTIIMLSDLEGLSYREIAETLDIPMGTVMSRLHNARKRLRDALGPLLMVLLCLGALLGVLAAPRPAEAQGALVRFGARVLLGADGPPPQHVKLAPLERDERLEAFIPKLRQLFRYREYYSLERYRAQVPVGTPQAWAVPGDRWLHLMPEGVTGDTVHMRVTLVRGPVMELVTDIRAARGSPAVIGGPRYADGVLIIIVWANANPRPRGERR